MKGYKKYSPSLVSYNPFTELMQSCGMPLAIFMTSQRLSQTKGIAFVASTKLEVGGNPPFAQHIVFADIAQRGKTSTGWFYGFKLPLVIKHVGEMLSVVQPAILMIETRLSSISLPKVYGESYMQTEGRVVSP